MTSVHVIAPHLFSKKRSSRQRLPLSPLNQSYMSTTGNNSDPHLPDDTRSLQYAQDDAERALIKRTRKDGHGDDVLRRVSGKTDASDSGSSLCAWHDIHYIYGMLTRTFYSVSRDSSSARPEIEHLKQLLRDAEDRHLTALERAEKAAEARRACDLQAAEARRLSDLERAERRVREVEERAEKRIREVEERAEKLVHEVEELLRTILGIVYH